ncbi:MAG: hypothetical protein RDV41_13240 [Planctomycetota bacterium]|nr:hypothetical protein [Planctomycetota bacterium]
MRSGRAIHRKSISTRPVRLARPGRASRAGFTLIEITMVGLIMCIIVLAVVITLDNLTPTTRLRAGARDIGGLVRIARSNAIGQKRKLFIVYDVPGGKYFVRIPAPPREVGTLLALEEEQKDEDILIRRLPEGVKFVDIDKGESSPSRADEILIEVTPYGNVTPHAVHILGEMGGDETAEMTIEVNSLTGFVSYYDKYKALSQFETDEGD